jgi:hypothetical protein
VGTVRRSLEERFWDKVLIGDGCWEWTGYRRGGYGHINEGGWPCKTLRASRVMWELMRGPIPAGMCVCHNCPGGDNPGCVRPEHMFLGTHKDNMQDMFKKGMRVAAVGESCATAKLSSQQVRVLRRAHQMGVSCLFMSKLFKVSHTTVNSAVHRKTWKHIP